MINAIDIHRAVTKLWDDQGLDGFFKERWSVTDASNHIVLLDSEASPGQPFPYCVFDAGRPAVQDRSSAANQSINLRETREIAFNFNVHAKQHGITPAKILAAELIEKIIEVFGGHPTKKAKTLCLTHGGVLLCQYQTDFGIKTGDQEWQWVVEYMILYDVPVRA